MVISLRLQTWMVLAGLLWLGACSGRDDETEHVDVGGACVSGEQGQPHDVAVDFGLCLSSSCDELVEASCTAMLEGTTITVEASATVRTKTGRNVACTADCNSATASCDTPPLAPGTYTLVYGDDSVELTVPVATATCTAEFM